MLIRLSSVAVAIIATMPPKLQGYLHRKSIRDVDQHHMAGERQQTPRQ